MNSDGNERKPISLIKPEDAHLFPSRDKVREIYPQKKHEANYDQAGLPFKPFNSQSSGTASISPTKYTSNSRYGMYSIIPKFNPSDISTIRKNNRIINYSEEKTDYDLNDLSLTYRDIPFISKLKTLLTIIISAVLIGLLKFFGAPVFICTLVFTVFNYSQLRDQTEKRNKFIMKLKNTKKGAQKEIINDIEKLFMFDNQIKQHDLKISAAFIINIIITLLLIFGLFFN